jgi:hypothetical protein
MVDSYTKGGVNFAELGKNVSNKASSIASNVFSSLNQINSKYTSLDTFKSEVTNLKEKKPTMFLTGTLYLLRTNLITLMLIVVGVMLVFSLVYSKFNITGNSGYLTNPIAVISLVTGVVLLTTFVSTMVMGKKAVMNTLESN